MPVQACMCTTVREMAQADDKKPSCADFWKLKYACLPVVIGQFLPHSNCTLCKDDDVLLQLASDRIACCLVAGMAVGCTGVV